MEMLRSITLTVEISAAADIREAACDLCELAERVGVLVEADFNGVKLWARPGDNPLRLVDAYHEQIGNSHKFKIAQVR